MKLPRSNPVQPNGSLSQGPLLSLEIRLRTLQASIGVSFFPEEVFLGF